MDSISSNPLLGSYAQNFDYAALGKKKVNPVQSVFDSSSNNKSYVEQEDAIALQKNSAQGLFAQNLYEASIKDNAKIKAAESAGQGKTASKGPTDANAVFQEEFKAKLAANGNDLIGAMEYAKDETFKLLFNEELERNGGNVNAAISFATLETGMSAKELIGVLEDLAKENQGSEEVAKALEDAINALDKKISMEDASAKLKEDDNTKANSDSTIDDTIAASLMSLSSQNKDNVNNKNNANYKNNQQNIKAYEAMQAENTSGKNMYASGRASLDMMV